MIPLRNSLEYYLELVIEGKPGDEHVRELLHQADQGVHDPVGHPLYILLDSTTLYILDGKYLWY